MIVVCLEVNGTTYLYRYHIVYNAHDYHRYKILFLDVLFPLNVEKIIYVDADQVVRADLKELWDLDLQGRVYGYTPFCESRNRGFQFWRQGYIYSYLSVYIYIDLSFYLSMYMYMHFYSCFMARAASLNVQ
jgi:hypothetical protein